MFLKKKRNVNEKRNRFRGKCNKNTSWEDAYSKEHIPERRLYRRWVIH
jgi:hypothetical protein